MNVVKLLRTRFAWQLYLGIVALILVGTVTISLILHRAATSSSLREIRHSLRNEASYLADLARPALVNGRTAELSSELTELSQLTGTRLTVIDADGVVLADSHEDPAKMENHASRTEIIAARNYGEGQATHFSMTLHQRMMYFALPINADGRLIGFARSALPLTAIDERLALLRLSVLAGMAVALVLSLPLGYAFARLVTRPLTEMTDAARRIAGGEYGQRLHHRREDEFGLLMDALNEMSASLERRMEQLAAEGARLAAMLSSMQEAVVAVDNDERVVHLNSSAARLCSVRPEDAGGMRSWEAIRLPELNALIALALSSGVIQSGELNIPGAGSDHSYTITVAPWRDRAGHVLGAVAVLHDVSRLRQIEKMRQDFIANASHELKTPVTAIGGFAETLLEDGQMPADTRQRFLQHIFDDAQRLSRLVQDMLALSRAEGKSGAPEQQRLDLRDVAQQAVDALAARAAAQEVALVSELQQEAVGVQGDAVALRTAVTNLIDNALNYTPAGGRVTVSVVAEGGEGIVEVCDTGCGIPAEHLSRIFERFYRVDTARSRELGGTGLGLSIVRHTALNHGGRVSVQSSVAHGSTFTITLPLLPAAN